MNATEDAIYDPDAGVGWSYSDDDRTLRLWVEFEGSRTDVAIADGAKRETRLQSIPADATEMPARQFIGAAIGMQILASHARAGRAKMTVDGAAIEFDADGSERDLPLTIAWADAVSLEELRAAVVASLNS